MSVQREGTFTPPGTPIYNPTPAASSWTPTPPVGPRRWSVISILAFVSAFLPALAFVLPEELALVLAVGGAVSAIVLGAIGMSQTKRDRTLKGRGFAIAGLVLGIIEVSLGIVAAILVMILVAALGAACAGAAGACGGGSQLAPLALAFARDGRSGLAHHPACGHYEADVFRLGATRICVGCSTAVSSLVAGLAGLVVVGTGVDYRVWLLTGSALGLAQLVSVAGWTTRRATKVAVKTLTGLGIAAFLWGLWLAPWPDWIRAGIVLGGYTLVVLSGVPRRARMKAHADLHASA